MDRYASGDEGAFEEVYDAVAPRVLALALRLLRNRVQAEDIVQQTLLNIHRARGSFIPGAELLPWAYAIAHRLIIDTMRRRWREELLGDREIPEGKSSAATPHDEMMAHETAGSLSMAFAELPESQQTVLQLRNQGMSLAEVAQALGTTVIAVKLRLHRATESLVNALKGGGKPRR